METLPSQNWFLFVYMVVLMSGMNSVSQFVPPDTIATCAETSANHSSHISGSQDLYATFLKRQAGMGATQTTVMIVVGQIGALVGSTTIGYFSSFTGRRLAMMVACVLGGAIVPAYIVPRNDSPIASTFFQLFFVGGVWRPTSA